jgi:flagellar biosynthesis protein FliQ
MGSALWLILSLPILLVTILRGIVVLITIQAMDGFYHDQHLGDMFLPLVMEVFNYL